MRDLQSFDEVVENCLRIWFFNYDETADHSGHRVAMREIVSFVTAAKEAEIERLREAIENALELIREAKNVAGIVDHLDVADNYLTGALEALSRKDGNHA